MQADAQKALARINVPGFSRTTLGAVLPPGFKSGLFEGLTPSEIQAILAAARLRRIFPGEVLLHEGEPTAHSFLLVTGRAAAYTLTAEGQKLFLRWIAPGDAFGLATQQPETATVEAVLESTALAWDRASAQALGTQYPQLRRNAYSSLASYLRQAIDLIAARASQSARRKLAQVLVQSAGQIGLPGREGTEIDLTNEQLAEMADVSLFTVSRQLSQWQRQGILAKHRGKILLHSPERLLSLGRR